jgi:hypothetical protein
LRSDKNHTKRPGNSFRADSLQQLRRLSGGRTVRHVRQIDRSQDAAAAAVVPFVCKSDLGRRQAGVCRLDVGMSGAVESGRERGHSNIDTNHPELPFAASGTEGQLTRDFLSIEPVDFLLSLGAFVNR